MINFLLKKMSLKIWIVWVKNKIYRLLNIFYYRQYTDIGSRHQNQHDNDYNYIFKLKLITILITIIWKNFTIDEVDYSRLFNRILIDLKSTISSLYNRIFETKFKIGYVDLLYCFGVFKYLYLNVIIFFIMLAAKDMRNAFKNL